MIDSISIKGFKKIQECNFEKLSSVNYLVGPNGCGKSSILESLVMIGRNGEPNPALINRIIPILGNTKDIFSSSGGYIRVTGSNPNSGGLLNQYTLTPGGNIITPEQGNQISLSTRGFVLTNLREISGFNKSLKSDYNYGIFELIKFDSDIVDSSSREMIIGFLNDYFFNEFRDEKKIIRLFRSIDSDGSIQLEKEGGEIMNLKALSSGQLSLLGLYFSVYSAIETLVSFEKYEYLILIDEPENSFHPDLHKEINDILLRIVKEIKEKHSVNIQFIISTHSPFIISSIRKSDSSKVYLIKNGKTVNMRMVPGKIDGFKGNSCMRVASSMLGAGLRDLVPTRNIPDGRDSMLRLIYCEGSGEELDSKYYNIIFPEFGGVKNHFISVGGGNDVVIQQYIGNDLSGIVGGNNITSYGLVDRSNSSELGFLLGDRTIRTDGINMFTNEERNDFLIEYPNVKMLSRREIENYLYDPEILALNGVEITEDITRLDFIGGEIKNKIADIKKLRSIDKVDLARLIKPDTKIYKELANDIFSPIVINLSATISARK